MKTLTFRKTFAAMIAVASLAFCSSAYADDDDWGDDPGDDPGMEGPQPGDPEYCDWYGHSWISEGSDEPSCEYPGYDVYYCVNCGEHDFRNEVPPLGHKFVNGYCIRCGQSQLSYTFVPAVDPTCTASGHVAYLLGSDNKWYDPTTTNQLYWITLSALGHNYGAWTTNKPPTCTTAGQKTRSCTRAGCTASETQAIPALGHDFVAGTPVPPTCTTQGYTPYACSRCNAAENRDVVSALGHDWTAWITNTPPTCTTAGEETHSCTRCNETVTQPIPALGHNYSAWTTNTPPTCTSTGLEGSFCTRCGEGESNVIPALGHDWSAWTLVAPANYACAGEEARDCSRCDAHETREIPMLQHSKFSVGGSGNTFTISRSGEGTNFTETVFYRAVGLTAYAGQNFTSKSGSFTFLPGQTFTNVTVSTRTPYNDAYKFQNGTTRAYRFELLDAGGFRLDGKDRTITAGTSVSTNGTFGIKSVTIKSGETTVTDGGYIVNPYLTMAASGYFNNAAPKTWFQQINAQLRMTLSMQVKEVHDGYQYIQVLFDNTSTCDDRSKCSDGNPGNINLSRYMAGFGHHPGSYDGNYSTYTFPVTSAGNNCGTVNNPWNNSISAKLYDQKFKSNSYRSGDGKLIIPTDFTNLVLRLNASGDNQDNWTCKSVIARIQAVDSALPTLLGATVSPGPYHRGNTVTVSLAFSEIVVPTPSSGFYLSTSWGPLGFEGGACGNVLAFSGRIADGTTDNTPLSITGFSGLTSIKDLAGNTFGGSVSRSFNDCVVTPSVDYTISYDLAGGTLPPDEDPNPVVYNYDSDVIFLTNPVRPGYTFVGWSGTDINGSVFPTEVFISRHRYGDRAYRAHWTPTVYSIVYDDATNGVAGVFNPNPTSYTVEDGTIALSRPTRTGCIFNGWYVDPGFTGAPVSSFSAADLGDRTFYAKWTVLPWSGSGTEADPFRVSSSGQFDAIATYVRAGYGVCRNGYYRLDADIAYDPANENNYTPISSDFKGVLDGNGHTISGIRINKNDGGREGLFSQLDGTVMNLTLADSVIGTGGSVGGIAGEMLERSVVSNCFVTGTTLLCGYYSGMAGAIVGSHKSGRYPKNAYHRCAVLVVDSGISVSTNTFGIGSGNKGDVVATQCYVLSLAEGIAADTAPRFAFPVYGTTNSYYADNQRITVRAAYGYAICNVAVNGGRVAVTDNGDGSFSFWMPSADATVTADVESISIPYVDADGVVRHCADYTVISNASGRVAFCATTDPFGDLEYDDYGTTNWYVVTGAVTISGDLIFGDDDAHLILCDGASLTVTAGIDARGNITIYGQTNGTGSVTATDGFGGIYANRDFTVNGGSVTATSANGGIIAASGCVTINGGIVAATGDNVGIYSLSTVTINGGNVAVNGGIAVQNCITLGWRDPSDSIYASSYTLRENPFSDNRTVGIKDGQKFTDGFGGIYEGDVDPDDLAGKTLRPFVETPTYPAYLDDAGYEVRSNYDDWAKRYGHDALGVNEAAFLLDVAPGAVTNGVAHLKVAEIGATNVLYEGSLYQMFMEGEFLMHYSEEYLPCRRFVVESDTGALKPGPWREYTGEVTDVCNGYIVLNVSQDLSLPKSEWSKLSWFVDYEGDRAVVTVPDMFIEGARRAFENRSGKPVGGLFLSVGIEPVVRMDDFYRLFDIFLPQPPNE